MLIHHIVMIAPAASARIAKFFQLLLGNIFLHAKLVGVFAQLVSIILAGSVPIVAATNNKLL